MKVSFHGAARTVTGSKHLLELKNGKRVLLDCGMFQGGRDLMEKNYRFGFNPEKVDVVVLSHAHIDHSGLLPRLYKEGFRGKIFCTEATRDLVKILLKDSARIQEADIRHINKIRKKRSQKLIKPLFTETDVEGCLKLLQPKVYQEEFDVCEDIKCKYTDAGHILGSAVVNLTIKENEKTIKLCFTGDIGRYCNPILRKPESISQADYIICESTYGKTLHDDLVISDKILEDILIETCVKKKGRLLIPAFSVGRTQEVVYALNRLEFHKKLENIKVFVDSPLSIEATKVTKAHKNCYNKELIEFMKKDSDPFGFSNLKYVKSVEESKSLNDETGPMVIISASGMAEFGRIKHHIAHAIQDQKNTILIVGYCEPNSLGARLQSDVEEVRIFGNYYKKTAEVKKIKSFSAHADYADMLNFLKDQNPKKVKKMFLVHGNYDVQLDFKRKLVKKGFDFVEIPKQHQEFHIG